MVVLPEVETLLLNFMCSCVIASIAAFNSMDAVEDLKKVDSNLASMLLFFIFSIVFTIWFSLYNLIACLIRLGAYLQLGV